MILYTIMHINSVLMWEAVCTMNFIYKFLFNLENSQWRHRPSDLYRWRDWDFSGLYTDCPKSHSYQVASENSNPNRVSPATWSIFNLSYSGKKEKHVINRDREKGRKTDKKQEKSFTRNTIELFLKGGKKSPWRFLRTSFPSNNSFLKHTRMLRPCIKYSEKKLNVQTQCICKHEEHNLFTSFLEPYSQKNGLISTASYSGWFDWTLFFSSWSQWWHVVFSLHLWIDLKTPLTLVQEAHAANGNIFILELPPRIQQNVE